MIFSGDRRNGRPVDKIRNVEGKNANKKIYTLLLRPRPDFCGGGGGMGTPRNFQFLAGFFAGRAGHFGPRLKI